MKRSFGDNIYTGRINVNEAEMHQSNFLENTIQFNNKTKPKKKLDKEKMKCF